MKRRALRRWWPALAWAILIFIGSSIPGHSLPHFSLWDKLEHAIEYSIFSSLLAYGFGLRRWWWAIVVGALFGVTDEFHQTFTPGRSGNDLGDMTADLVGSILGASVYYLARRRATKTA